MPLQLDPSMTWPPPDAYRAMTYYAEWDAWYHGEPAELAAFYGSPAIRQLHPSQLSGGVVGRLARFWWGRPTSVQQPAAKIHVPLAADLAMLSADLLWGSPPDIDLPSNSDQGETRWSKVQEYGQMTARLTEAAEVCAALGGVYLKASVAPSLVAVPFLNSVPPECAVPTWTLGWLTSVIFWRSVGGKRTDGNVFRLLELHEPGAISYALYRGTDSKLGSAIDMRSMPESAALVQVDATGGVAQQNGDGVTYATGIKGLTACYIPNMLPNRAWKGSPLGRSDYDGSTGLMDAVDEAYSSLIRDIRTGKSRIIVPQDMLRDLGPGKGAAFDDEQAIFTGLAGLPGSTTGGSQLLNAQFAIRANDHLVAARGFAAEIMKAAGYDAGELDDQATGGPKTATEVANDGSRSIATRGRKINYWTPALSWAAITLAQLDLQWFRSGLTLDDDPNIEWPDSVAVDPEKVARTIGLLSGAKAISTQTSVEMFHPDWDATAVDEEVARILEESGQAVEQPGTGFNGAGAALDPTTGQPVEQPGVPAYDA